VKQLGRFCFCICVAVSPIGAVCQQQNAACQPTDYAAVGAEIASTAASIQGAAGNSGLSQEAIQSIVDGYTQKRVELAATNCAPSAAPATARAAQVSTPNAKSLTQPAKQSKSVASGNGTTTTISSKSSSISQSAPPSVPKVTTPAASPASGKCPDEPIDTTRTDLTPTIKAIAPGTNVQISGAVPGQTSGTVQICVNEQPAGNPVPVGKNGNFAATVGMLTGGESIVAQFTSAGTAPTFGPTTEMIVGAAATCPNEVVDTKLPTPTLDAIDVNAAEVTGTVAKETNGNVQLCSGGTLVGDSVGVKTGTFTISSSSNKLPTLSTGQMVTAQFTNAAGISGPASDPLIVVAAQKHS
jgi:hypothetical protein